MRTETMIGETEQAAAATGVPGLDDVLRGGFERNRLFLIEGVPGSGKTTLALQYLREGVRAGESVLYVTLSETAEELRAVGRSHGWDLSGIAIHEVIPPENSLLSDEHYTMFHPSEVELTHTTHAILTEVERLRPSRVVFDSLSEVRMMAGSPLRYRRQIMAMKRYFAGRKCTVLLLDDLADQDRDLQVQSITHGVILLGQSHPDFGAERRRLRVVKYRGRPFRGGFHDYSIRVGGLEVFPRLVAAEHRQMVAGGRLSSGIPELDDLLGGGLERGSSTLLVGPPGTGKSSVAVQFLAAAAQRGEHAGMYIFDESYHTLVTRAAGMEVQLGPYLEAQQIEIHPIDPAELSPGEFAHRLRTAVEHQNYSLIVIDSLNGYLNAMPDERFLNIQLHELLNYLGQRGVATLLVAAHQGLIGTHMASPVEATYLADAVVLLRYFEAMGEVKKAISVIKKRGGLHERTIREFAVDRGGIKIGSPLRQFRGVLTGVPVYLGGSDELIQSGHST